MRKTGFALIGAWLIAGAMPSFSFGQCCNLTEPHVPGGDLPHFLISAFSDEICSKGVTYGERLGLTKNQYDQLSKLRSEYRKKLVGTVSGARRNYGELSAALSAHPVDTKTALAKFQKASDLSSSLNQTYVSLCVQAGKVFTEKQRTELRQLLEGELKTLGVEAPTPAERQPH